MNVLSVDFASSVLVHQCYVLKLLLATVLVLALENICASTVRSGTVHECHSILELTTMQAQKCLVRTAHMYLVRVQVRSGTVHIRSISSFRILIHGFSYNALQSSSDK